MRSGRNCCKVITGNKPINEKIDSEIVNNDIVNNKITIAITAEK